MRFRESTIETVAEEGKEPVLRVSVSSETPVLTEIRMGDQWMMAYEILDHSESSIDRSRCADGLVIQDTHWGDQVGLIRAPMVLSKKLGGIIEFCTGERAQDIAQDAAKGLRRNMSVGYRCDPTKYVIEGSKDDVPVVRCMRWTPYEASFVNVPADTGVGVGRSLENKTPEVSGEGTKSMNPKEMAEMFARAAKFGIGAEKVEALIADGKGRAELDGLIVEAQGATIEGLRKVQKPDVPTPRADPLIIKTPEQTVPDKEIRQYHISNVIRHMAGDASVDIGREREISQELARQRGKSANGIIVPHAALCRRALTVAGTSSATVATEVMASEFIDLLRSNSILGELGVRMIPGLRGNLAIPKLSAGATGYWVAEAVAITGSQPTLGQVTGTPHTCGMLVDISRLLLNQSAPAADMIVQDDIVEGLARTIQTAVFAGTGADGQPSAITTASGIANPSVTQGTPTYAELLAFPGGIIKYKAQGTAMKWAMTGEVWAKLAATATNGAGSPLALNPETGRLCGYQYASPCDDLPTNSLWFGDWSSVNVGVWGNGVDITLDTSTLSSSGGLRIVGLQDVDVMVRLGAKLAYNLAVTS